MEEVVAAGRQAGRQVARAPASMTRLAVVVASSILVRLLVARWPHSGQGQPPLFGDFEAQRHWMEITVKLPVRDWYWYDIEYWGLDYPPLTAYVSWMCGMVCEWLIPESMALDESRGFEKPALKALVRGLVVALDALVWMPAALMALRALHRHGNSGRKGRSEAAPSWSFYSSSMAFLPSAALALMQPSQILIDHGHHQYNCVCTGLAVGGAVLIDAGWQLTGAFLFCLSINFKHMALFYAPAFFFFLLAKAIDTQRPTAAFRTVASLGAVVVFTFAALWGPFCYAEILSEQSSRSCIEGLGQVLSRIFPFGRGIFEDKVANLWFCADLILNLRQHFSQAQLALLALCLTSTLLAPVGLALFRRRKRRNLRILLLAMFTSAMAFFLASFQVHEKGILLPVMPLSLLWREWPHFVGWVQLMACGSLFPLMRREGLALPLVVCTATYAYGALAMTPQGTGMAAAQSVFPPQMRSLGTLAFAAAVICSVGSILSLHVAQAFWNPPPNLPHIYTVLNAVISCCSFSLSYLLGLMWLWSS